MNRGRNSPRGLVFTIAATASLAAALLPLTASAAGVRSHPIGRHASHDACPPSGSVGKPMTANAQKHVLEAMAAMDANDLGRALTILDRISKYSLHPFGIAVRAQMRAGIAAARDDLEGAEKYMRESIGARGFCGDRLAAAQLQLAQIQMAREHWDDAIDLLDRLVASSAAADGETYYRLGLARYRAGRMDEALAATQKAIDLGGDQAKEIWWQLLIQIHWDRKEYDACIPILQRLIVEKPKRDYWLRLGFALYETGRTAEALVALQLGDLAGVLDQKDDQLRLVQMEFAEGLPSRAAERLAKAIDDGRVQADQKTLEVLSNAWLAARDRDRSIGSLTRAADLASDGRDWLRVAQIRAQQDDWKEVGQAASRALDKGGLDNEGLAWLLLGMARFNSKDPVAARAAFVHAQAFEQTRRFATTWLGALDEASASRESAGTSEATTAQVAATPD